MLADELKNRWLQRLRNQLWLKALRSREGCGKSTYFLDQKYSTGAGLSSAERRKEFSYIANKKRHRGMTFGRA